MERREGRRRAGEEDSGRKSGWKELLSMRKVGEVSGRLGGGATRNVESPRDVVV